MSGLSNFRSRTAVVSLVLATFTAACLDESIELEEAGAERLAGRLEPIEVVCVPSDRTPMLADEVIEAGLDIGMTSRSADRDEEDGGLPTAEIDRLFDEVVISPVTEAPVLAEPQAGTFIHELGHTLSLTQENTFRLIDTTAWFSYDSAMNYIFQATMVDFSDSGQGGDTNDHDDWEDVDPAYGLGYSFGQSTHANDGVCD